MLERQLAPLKISRSDLKRFKNHRVDKKTHTHTHPQSDTAENIPPSLRTLSLRRRYIQFYM